MTDPGAETGRGAGAGSAGGGGSGGAASGGGMRLRLARQARGFSQQQLAGMAGVSRQAVSAVESGLSDPSLRVALALGRALGMTVEEVFGPDSPVTPVAARPVAPLGDEGARVMLAPMGDEFVALPLAGASVSRAGFLPAGGLACGTDETGTHAVRPIGPPLPTLVVAGCDPAMPLLEKPLSLLDPPVAFGWWPCPSQEALRLAADGLVHVAGVHLRGRSGGYNTDPAGEQLRQGAEVIGFCSWREGLALRQELASSISGVGDVARRGLRLVNREPGSEARHVLDRELAELRIDGGQLPGYGTRATGHLQVAAAIAAGLADAGVASEPAALAYGLAFVPLAAERFDLVIPADLASSREVQALFKVLSSRWLLDQLASLPGYDPAGCGEHIATVAGELALVSMLTPPPGQPVVCDTLPSAGVPGYAEDEHGPGAGGDWGNVFVMRLLVLGGTHHVGRAVVETALARGDDVTTVNRGISGHQPPGARARHADRSDRAAMRAALGNGSWDAVIDTWSGAPRAVADAAALLVGRVGHYGYVSSRSVYRWPIPPGADESAPVVDGDPASADSQDYAAAKRGGELAVAGAFGDWALLARAGLILGPYERVGRMPWWLRRMELGGEVLAPGPQDRPLQYIDCRDLAAWMLAAAGQRIGGAFNAVSRPGHATMASLLGAARDVTGSRASLVWVSPEVIEAEGVEPWTELPIWLPPDGEFAGLHDGDVSAAYAAGLTCRPVEQTVADTWRWLQEEGYPPPPPPGQPSHGLSPDKERRVLASLGRRPG